MHIAHQMFRSVYCCTRWWKQLWFIHILIFHVVIQVLIKQWLFCPCITIVTFITAPHLDQSGSRSRLLWFSLRWFLSALSLWFNLILFLFILSFLHRVPPNLQKLYHLHVFTKKIVLFSAYLFLLILSFIEIR